MKGHQEDTKVISQNILLHRQIQPLLSTCKLGFFYRIRFVKHQFCACCLGLSMQVECQVQKSHKQQACYHLLSHIEYTIERTRKAAEILYKIVRSLCNCKDNNPKPLSKNFGIGYVRPFHYGKYHS